MLTTEQIESTSKAFEPTSVKIHPKIREDAIQHAWQYFLGRRSVQSGMVFQDPKKHRSVARSCVDSAKCHLAAQHARNQRLTRQYLECDSLESSAPLTALHVDDESLSDSAIEYAASVIDRLLALHALEWSGAWLDAVRAEMLREFKDSHVPPTAESDVRRAVDAVEKREYDHLAIAPDSFLELQLHLL